MAFTPGRVQSQRLMYLETLFLHGNMLKVLRTVSTAHLKGFCVHQMSPSAESCGADREDKSPDIEDLIRSI